MCLLVEHTIWQSASSSCSLSSRIRSPSCQSKRSDSFLEDPQRIDGLPRFFGLGRKVFQFSLDIQHRTIQVKYLRRILQMDIDVGILRITGDLGFHAVCPSGYRLVTRITIPDGYTAYTDILPAISAGRNCLVENNINQPNIGTGASVASWLAFRSWVAPRFVHFLTSPVRTRVSLTVATPPWSSNFSVCSWKH